MLGILLPGVTVLQVAWRQDACFSGQSLLPLAHVAAAILILLVTRQWMNRVLAILLLLFLPLSAFYNLLCGVTL